MTSPSYIHFTFDKGALPEIDYENIKIMPHHDQLKAFAVRASEIVTDGNSELDIIS